MHLFKSPYADPVEELLRADLPAGEPWGWLFAQRLLSEQSLARRLLGQGLTPGLSQWVAVELKRLRKELGQLQQEHRFADFGTRPPAPAEEAALRALSYASPESLAQVYRAHGYGAFTRHTAFLWGDRLHGVTHPDPARFFDLVGYERQIARLRTNVERFLEGKPSVPTLLYGARGCGKSTAVKALRTAYAEQGLRLVEVHSEGLERLPELLELLRPLPHRFVLYLDDLAIAAEDPRFHTLKALLEGAVYERPANVLVLATSNRRNLVVQSFADRPAPDSGDPAAWDTLQDKLALADRFGLVLTFPPFDQRHYLATVASILERELEEDTRKAALEFALDGRGFSGRTARHFANTVIE